MRITFIDSANKKSEVLTEYENGPIDVTTQAERESKFDSQSLCFDNDRTQWKVLLLGSV